jgi:hypothetical protein
MSPFEQQVEQAIASIEHSETCGANWAHTEGDGCSSSNCDYDARLAARVSAAIEATSEDVWRAVAPAGEAGGDLAKARQEARESALAALRGEQP